MRSTRVKRRRKKNDLPHFMVKAVSICYIILFSMSYVTSDTIAYFNSAQQVKKMTITAGSWEETQGKETVKESVLSFVDQKNTDTQMCPAVVEVEIENSGNTSMQGSGSYDIYYTETGDPQQDGEKVEIPKDEGVIEILERGETTTLAYEVELPGIYVFVAYQHNEDVEEDGVWSEGIQIVCGDETEQETVEENANDEQREKDDTNKDEESDESETNVDDEQDEESTDRDSEETKDDESSPGEETDEGSEDDSSNVDTKETEEDGTSDEQETDDEVDE